MTSLTSALPLVTTHLTDEELAQDPHARYAELRRSFPVARTNDQLFRGREGFLLTRYDDVMLLFTDPRFSSDPKTIGKPSALARLLERVQMLKLLTDSMPFKDDPDHTRLRGLVNMAFTPRVVQKMESDVERIVGSLIDAMAVKGSVDLVKDLAAPLPLNVISKMLGVEEADRDQFHAWMLSFASGANDGPLHFLRALPNGHRMVRLFKRIVAERRADPDDKLISGIVLANQEGDQLSDHEVLAMIFLLLLAGHDTTANLIGNSVLSLIEHPEQLRRLRENPDLIDTAVEEMLRYTSPVTNGVPRVPKQDVEICGVPISKGRPIYGLIIAGNRDEEAFSDPDVLDIGRTPNRHLSFGFGAHFCLGNQLARLEARIALRTLVERFDQIELAVPRDQIRYKAGSLRGLRSLPLNLH